MVGDPSGRDSTRPMLDAEKIRLNGQTYQEQAFKVLDPEKTELLYNSEWLEPFVQRDLLSTLQRYTVQQITAREDFQKRLKEQNPISLLELTYPILQGYDSIAIKSDVELGGNDQWSNIIAGVELTRKMEQEQVYGLTFKLLTTSPRGRSTRYQVTSSPSVIRNLARCWLTDGSSRPSNSDDSLKDTITSGIT